MVTLWAFLSFSGMQCGPMVSSPSSSNASTVGQSIFCVESTSNTCLSTAFAAAKRRAGLGADVTPHVLKHTAITWAVQIGVGIEEAAEYFDTSSETIRKHYWHHSPLHKAAGRAAVERLGKL